MAEIFHFREPDRVPLVLRQKEIKRILAMASSLKARVMLSLAYGCGLRAGEVVRLKVGDIPAEQLIQQVHMEFAQLLGIGGKPVLQRCRHWSRGLPQYDMQHSEKKSVLLNASQRIDGLFITGNYLSGVSIANCIAQAKNTAEQAHRFLLEIAVSRVYKSG